MSTAARELARQIPSPTAKQGREDLNQWERSQPTNYYDSDLHLQRLLGTLWGEARLQQHVAQLSKFGHEAATIVDPAARRANQAENLPRLDRFTATGERTENLQQSPDHHLAGRHIYSSGLLNAYAEPQSNLLAMALFYLSSYNGEAGHNCPVSCTAGIIKTLQHVGSEELKAKYLPGLLYADYDRLMHGAQFLTEVQGGSDVGANACTAMLLDAKTNRWVINGEKWFCSNASADLILMTARPAGAPAGTKGLGLFLVPRRLDDGSLNGIYLRRLKDKLGTKSMATAEIDFKDAIGYQIGEAGKGFQHAMDFVINTSRLYNAVGSTGAARRAYVIAWTYAQHRQAFGQPLKDIPLIQETLAEMKATTMAITSGSLFLAHLRDQIESGQAGEDDQKFFRFVVNLNKYRSSILATDIIRKGIEVLGGNGAMENFSVLPRLLRDSVIFEAWEGAHGTLLAQSARDIHRYKLDDVFAEKVKGWFRDLKNMYLGGRGISHINKLSGKLFLVHEGYGPSGALILKPIAERMMWLFYIACLARLAEQDESVRPALDWLWRKHIEDKPDDPRNYFWRIAEISSTL